MTDIWSGNPDNLPPESTPFEYNGNEYMWISCPCGCGHPLAFEKSGRGSFEMTVRLRGNDQGESQGTFLVKLGKTEELIGTCGDGLALAELISRTVEKILKEYGNRDALDEFLKSKNIPRGLMLTALKKSSQSYLEAITDFLLEETVAHTPSAREERYREN